jgi:hypothetical protein
VMSWRSTWQIKPHFSITAVEVGHMALGIELYFFIVDKNFECLGGLSHKQDNGVAKVAFITECGALANAAITLTLRWLSVTL